jgi:hypothetical protein
MTSLIGFPNPVNEKAARAVAGGVLGLSVLALVMSAVADDAWLWIIALLALGFLARVLAGPRFSPLGQLATKIVAPHLGEPKLVPGPPKRFAQAMGAAMTITGVAFLAAGYPVVTQAVLGLMIVAAGLESIFAYCVGCKMFAGLMRLGLIPDETCAACANIALRVSTTAP